MNQGQLIEEEMSDAEMWGIYRLKGKKKRQANLENSLNVLRERDIKFQTLDQDVHYRIGDWDFWPTTGKYWNRKTQEKGRGVFNLIKRL